MSNLYSSVANVIKSSNFVQSAMNGSFGNLATNSTLSNLRTIMSSMWEDFKKKKDFYDSLGAVFANIPEIYDDAAEQLSKELPYGNESGEHFVALSDESALVIMSGVQQALNSQTLNGYESTDITQKEMVITDIDGNNYDLTFDVVDGEMVIYQNVYDGVIPLFFKSNGVFYLNAIMSSIRNTRSASVRQTAPTIQDCLANVISKISVINAPTSSIRQLVLSIMDYYSISYTSSTTIINGLSLICEHLQLREYGDTVSSMSYAIYTHVCSLSENRTPITYVAKSIITASDINNAYSSICEAILSSSPVESIQSLMDSVSERSKIVRDVLSRAMERYRQGGLRGLMSFVIDYFRGGSSLILKDGTMTFTNNLGYLPSEFIAGVVVSMVSAAAVIIGTVASAFGHVWGVALMSIGGGAFNLFNSVKSTHDDTYASIDDTFEGQLDSLGCLPIALLQGEIYDYNNSFRFFKRQYQVNGGPGYFSVPGGIIIFGPLYFNAFGNPGGFRYEFHPSALCFKGFQILGDDAVDINSFDTALWPFVDTIDTTGPKNKCWNSYLFKAYPSVESSNVMGVYQKLVSECGYNLQNSDSGHLNSSDDLRMRLSIMVHCGFFFMWLAQQPYSYNAHVVIDSNLEGQRLCVVGPAGANKFIRWCCLYACNPYADLMLGPSIPSWNELIEFFANNAHIQSVRLDIVDNTALETAYGMFSDQFLYGAHLYRESPLFKNLSSDTLYSLPLSPCVQLPSEFSYSVKVPKYNASTYWFWVILATAVSAAVVIATVVYSFKIRNWIKRKRATNKAGFDSAQEAYNSALNGEYTTVEVNPETGEKEEVTHYFDVNSIEGKERINQAWNSYKTKARRNNLWANVIGGSRYDVGSFWGEMDTESADELSLKDKLSSLMSDQAEENYDQVRSSSNELISKTNQDLSSLISSDYSGIRTLITGEQQNETSD